MEFAHEYRQKQIDISCSFLFAVAPLPDIDMLLELYSKQKPSTTVFSGGRGGAWGKEREDCVLISDINPYCPKRKVGLPVNAVKKIHCTEIGIEGCNECNNHIAGLRTVAQAMARRALLRGYGHGVPCQKVVSSCLKMEAVFLLNFNNYLRRFAA